MAAHSSNLAWRIPWTKEPGGLWSLGPQSQTRLKQLSMHARVGHSASEGRKSRPETEGDVAESEKQLWLQRWGEEGGPESRTAGGSLSTSSDWRQKQVEQKLWA